MRKILKGCIGFFVFILALFIYNDVVLADHSSCATKNCTILRQVAYVCPNNQSDNLTSAATCVMSMMNGSTAGMSLIDSDTSVPLKYDDTHATIIVLVSYFVPNQVDRIAAYTATTEYDPDKLDLIMAYGVDTDFPYTTGLFGSKTQEWPAPTITYGYGLTGVYGGSASNSEDIFPGLVKVNNAVNLTGTKLLPDAASKPGPYPVYTAYAVKSTADNGETYFRGYETDEATYGIWMEAARRDASNKTETFFAKMEDLTFTLGDKVELQYPIENIRVYSDSGKTKEYYFGVPGTTYTTASHVEFAAGTNNYDLYLPANTTSIYIDTKVSDGSTAGGDVGTKVVSIGSSTFTISGTSSGDDPQVVNYTITYHVPDNSLKNLTSTKGMWSTKTNTSNGFSSYNYNYTVYIKPTDASSINFTSLLNDATGAIQTEKNSTTVTAKTTNSAGSVTDTLTDIATNTTYTVKSYGADCDAAYTAVLGECEYKTYTLNLKILDRSLKSITVTGTSSGSPVYGISSSDFAANSGGTYTVYIPHSESSVVLSMEANNPTDTPNPADINKAINSDGVTSVKIVTTANADNLPDDDYTLEYNVDIYRLSENADLDSASGFTSSQGELTKGTAYTDETDSDMTVIPYTLTVGNKISTTTFTTTADKSTAYVKNASNGKSLSEDWEISETTPYEVIVYSESCKSAYSSIPGNTCKKTKIKVEVSKLSTETGIADGGIFVADTSASAGYTVTAKEDGTYSVTVPSNKTEVYVAVTPKATGKATVSYGSNVNSSNMVSLGSQNTNVVATITAEDTNVHTDYTITIHKASRDATLKKLDISDADFGSSFNANSPSDNTVGKIEADKASVTYTAEANYSLAKLDNQTTGPNKYTDETWTFDTNKVQSKTITVYAESCFVTGDTCESKQYSIEITKKKTESKLATITVKGSDNSVIKSYTISSASDPTSYTVGIPATETSATIEVTKVADSDETVKFNSEATESLTLTVNPLSIGNNNQTIHVESEYGGSYKTDYTVNLYKVTEDTSLTFTSNKGIGTPFITAHATEPNTFVLKILNNETSATITSTANEKSYVNDETTGHIKNETWNFGNPESYTVTVYPERCKAAYNNGTACTSTDGVTYTLIRNAVSNETKPNKIIVKSEDGTEKYGEIDFTTDPAPTTYVVNVPTGVTGVKIEVEGKTGQEVSLPGTNGVVTGLTEGANIENVGMTASDGSTNLTYPVTIYVPYTVKDLTAISVASPATISPETISEATDNTFTVSVSDKATQVLVSATASTTAFINTEATGNSISNAAWDITDETGSSSYTIKIFPDKCKAAHVGSTPCTDSDAKIYTLNINKLSSNKTLNGVSVNGTAATWDSTSSKWKVLLPPSATSATITCDATSPMTCTGNTIAELTDGVNSTTVGITAEDTSTGSNDVEIYRVSNKIGISGITFSNGTLKETSTPDGTYAYTGKFSDTKETTTVVPTPKYNGYVDGTLADWDLTGDTVANYTFTIKSESCKSDYASISDIASTCATQEYTLTYEAISSSGTLGSISVKGNDNVEYFTETISGFNYTVYVPSTLTSATITVAPEVAGTNVNPTTETLSSLVEGANPTVSIVVTPQDTSVSPNTYTITVYKLNNNALLNTLTASTGTIPTLSDSEFNYDLSLTDGSISSTNISATAKSAKAKLYVNSSTTGVEKEITNEAWNLSNNTFTIKVKSEACEYQSAVLTECEENTYTLTKKVLSNSVILDDLVVKNTGETQTYDLDKTFSSSSTSYEVLLPSGTTGAVIIIDPGTSGITISSQSITSGGNVVKDGNNPNKIIASGLSTGDNTVTINLLAQNGTTTGSYEVNLHVKNSSTALSLSANPGEIKAGETATSLILEVPDGTTSSELTATLPSGATVKMNNVSKTLNTENKATDTWSGFSDGDTYTIEVTPEDGSPVTYTVTVDVLPPEQSGDNSITSLTADPGTLTGSGTSRTLTVPYGTTSTEISVTSATGSKVTMNGVAKNTNSGTETWSGFSDGDTFTIKVEAENGDPQDYVITVDVQDPTDEDKDASLKSIKVTKFDTTPEVVYSVYEPEFIPSQTDKESYEYAVFVPYETIKVDLAAVATNETLTPVYSHQNEVVLAVGDNQETISVTSKDGSTTVVYHINIYRISNEARLDSFDIGAGDLDPTFDPETYTYTSYISNAYPSTTVSYTLKYNKEYVTSESNTATSDTWNFNSGANTEYVLHTYAESCKAKFASVEGNTCVDHEYKITATFFSPKITSDVYKLTLETFNDGTVELDIIADAKQGDTGADIKGEQTDNPETLLKLFDAADTAEVPDGDPLATGMILKLIINTVEYDRRYIIVPGDVNGDSEVDVTDILYMVDHTLDTTPLTGCYNKAGDLNDDTEVDVTDILEVVDITLGIS